MKNEMRGLPTPGLDGNVRARIFIIKIQKERQRHMRDIRYRYRYICSGVVNPDDPLNQFRLISGNEMRGLTVQSFLRVTLTRDIALSRYSCDGYATSESDCTIAELQPVAIVRINGRCVQRPDLYPKLQPHEWGNALHKEGLRPTVGHGYMDSRHFEQYMAEKTRQKSAISD